MRLLLDLHVFLWYISADSKLPPAFRDAIQDATNEAFLSVASVWEAIIKYSIRKLPLPGPPEEYLPRIRERHKIASLAIEESTMKHLAKLPPLHRDPFDRILIAQSQQHNLTMLTVDDAIKAYSVKILPA